MGSFAMTYVAHDEWTTPGTFTFTWPAGISAALFSCWGGGAGGNSVNLDSIYSAGGGGGGGAFSARIVTKGAATTLTIIVGDGGLGGTSATAAAIALGADVRGRHGQPTQVLNGGIVAVNADGGYRGDTPPDGGRGGAVIFLGVGDVRWSGGKGGSANSIGGSLVIPKFSGGGGGSSAGPAANGNKGADSIAPNTPGIGGPAPSRGGDGGAGGIGGTPGISGSVPGGGGGGAGWSNSPLGHISGGAGAKGKVTAYWYPSLTIVV